MIPQELIEKAKEFSYPLYKEYGAPNVFQVDYAVEKGLKIGRSIGANNDIILISMILMDSMLGPALKLGAGNTHVEMAVEKVEELLSHDSAVTDEEQGNILHCIREHHGTQKFYSLESEVVCNADCYKFLSVAGVIGGIKNSRDMALSEMVKLYLAKAEEKWNALTLEICKKELEPQYQAIKKLFELYQ